MNTKRINRKKGQMEIMGLAVIVILISLGILFIIQFSLSKEPSNLKKSFTQSQMASNLLSSMLRTTTQNCFSNTVTEVLKDCAENYNAPNSQFRCESNQRSCDYSRSTITQQLESTLVAWGNQSYVFEAKIPGQSLIRSTNGRCSGEKESKQNFIQTSAGTMTITMDICS